MPRCSTSVICFSRLAFCRSLYFRWFLRWQNLHWGESLPSRGRKFASVLSNSTPHVVQVCFSMPK